LQKEYDMTVRWRTFPLHPETPEEGQLLEDLFRTTPEKIAAMIDHLRVTAEELGLPLGARNKTYNSRLAQELGLWAEDQGKGEPFHMEAFRAYFAGGLNLAKLPVLLELARNVGLPEEEAERILTNRAYKDKVDRDWADSRLKSIKAVPTFIMGQHKLIGAQSYEALAELVTHYGVIERKKLAKSNNTNEKRMDEHS
jgi:predicted DsbA family dithiol-disulfide isomerase